MSSRSTLRGIRPSPIVVEHEVGGVTCILKDAADLASHIAQDAGEQPMALAAGAEFSTRGQTLRMVQAARPVTEHVIATLGLPSQVPPPPQSNIVLRTGGDGSIPPPPSIEPPLHSGIRPTPPSSGLKLLSHAPIITLTPLPASVMAMPPGVTLSKPVRKSRLARLAWTVVAVLVAANITVAAFVLARMLWTP
jgi:hypothetical protein